MILKLVRGYYDRLAINVRETGPLKLHDTRPPILLVIIQDWNRVAEKAVRLALTLSPDVIAIHLTHLAGPQVEEHGEKLRGIWRTDVEQPSVRAGLPAPRLVILPAPQRSIYEPVLKFAQELESRFESRRLLVLIPEIVKEHWYQHILHTHYARRLRSQLLAHGGSRLTVMNVPWHLD